jgi:hypothetical protein
VWHDAEMASIELGEIGSDVNPEIGGEHRHRKFVHKKGIPRMPFFAYAGSVTMKA